MPATCVLPVQDMTALWQQYHEQYQQVDRVKKEVKVGAAGGKDPDMQGKASSCIRWCGGSSGPV